MKNQIRIVLILICMFGSTKIVRSQTGEARIVFKSNRSGTLQIYSMNPDGSGLLRLTENSAAEYCPVLSPDGSRIAFVSNRDGENRIYLMDTDGKNQHRLTDIDSEEDEPSWYPDGKSILFRKKINGAMALCAATTDGNGLVQVSYEKGITNPKIAPDGTRIIYTVYASGEPQIWVMSIEGKNPVRIRTPKGWALSPCFSPDCKRIVYTYSENPPFRGGPVEIHLMNADGSGDRALTRSGSVSEFPCWSPDGKSVAFQAYVDGNFEVCVMDVLTGSIRRLTNHGSLDGQPNWGKINPSIR